MPKSRYELGNDAGFALKDKAMTKRYHSVTFDKFTGSFRAYVVQKGGKFPFSKHFKTELEAAARRELWLDANPMKAKRNLGAEVLAEKTRLQAKDAADALAAAQAEHARRIARMAPEDLGDSSQWRQWPKNSRVWASISGRVGMMLRDGWRELTPSNQVYRTVSIEGSQIAIHRLVAETWLPDFDESLTVGHGDGNKWNCAVWNLEMQTQPENVRHAREVLGRNTIPKPCLVRKGAAQVKTASISEAARLIGTQSQYLACKLLDAGFATVKGFQVSVAN